MFTTKPEIETTYVYLKGKRPGQSISFSLYGISPDELKRKIMSLEQDRSDDRQSRSRRRQPA